MTTPDTQTNVARALAPLTALDEQARAVPLGTLWSAGTAVLAFVRHFG
jgi:hypothetical protein